MTRRFDRSASGQKLHMQSLAALRHYDFNMAGAYSYEQAIETIRLLDLPVHDIEQQFRRAIFNVLIRNQDDHVKNIAFLMNRTGEWRLSPAYDVVYAYNPSGAWTNQHQMSLNGKRDHFELTDLIAFGEFCGLKSKRAEAIIRDLRSHLGDWLTYADQAGIPGNEALKIHRAMRHEIVVPVAQMLSASHPVSDASNP